MKEKGRRLAPETARCLKLACYWPLYGLVFYCAEWVIRPTSFHVMHCWLDDHIPFCEWFLIPYLFWFVYLVGIHLYTFGWDKPAFEKLMRFVILSYTAALVIFFLWPTCQLLRPAVFPRDNLLTDLVAAFYRTDTNTNVCPSLHVVGSLAVWYAARETKLFERRGWRVFFHLTTALICVSTVFLRQHSVLDVLAGLALGWTVGAVVFREEELRAQWGRLRGNRRRRRMSW